MEKAGDNVTELEITEAVRKIVHNSDLSQITERLVRNDIIETFGKRLGPMQDRIKTIVRAALNVVLNEKGENRGPVTIPKNNKIIEPSKAHSFLEIDEAKSNQIPNLNDNQTTKTIEFKRNPTDLVNLSSRGGDQSRKGDKPPHNIQKKEEADVREETEKQGTDLSETVSAGFEGKSDKLMANERKTSKSKGCNEIMRDAAEQFGKRKRRRRIAVIDDDADDDGESDGDADFEPECEAEDDVKAAESTAVSKKRRGRPPGSKNTEKKGLIVEEILDGDASIDNASVSEEDAEKPQPKRRRKRSSVPTESSDEKQLKKFQSIARSIGYRVPPIRFRGKTTAAEKREVIIIYLREKGFNILDRANLTPHAIERFRSKVDREKELAGLDTSNIIEENSGRRRPRRSSASRISSYADPPVVEEENEEDEESVGVKQPQPPSPAESESESEGYVAASDDAE